MYKEIDENGQYQLDCRLDSEKSLEENILALIDFVCEIKEKENGEKRVRNRHEGYGILADAYVAVTFAMKKVKDGMNELLAQITVENDAAAVDKIDSLTNTLIEAIVAITTMAALGRVISTDLFRESWSASSDSDDTGFTDSETK